MVTLRWPAAITVFALLIGPVLHAGEINWRTDYARAREEARDLNRPLLVYFTRPDCVWCAHQSAALAEHANAVNVDFIPVKADAWLAGQAGVDNFPRIVLALPSGLVVEKLSYRDGPALRKALDRALTRVPKRETFWVPRFAWTR